ncbi:hypothetical protein ACYZT3_10095 [Pseudomonas sp. MDT1-16]|nr:hypothetical protein [Pseudomonas sp. AL03]
MFEVFGGNLEQSTECFAAYLADPKRPVDVDDTCSGLRNSWSMAGLQRAGIVACVLTMLDVGIVYLYVR